MKKIATIFLGLLSIFSLTCIVDASVFQNSRTEIPYCSGNDCGLKEGIEKVEEAKIDGMVTGTTASAYIQRMLVYLLGFLRLAAIIFIIYAGFNILTSAGDEEKFNKSKTMLIYSIIGLAIIWLAGPITSFIIDLFTSTAT